MRPPKRVSRRFGLALKQLRLKRGLSQQEVADACGLDIGYVGSIERGQRNPTLGVIHSLASVLRVKASDLLLWQNCEEIDGSRQNADAGVKPAATSPTAAGS